MLTNKEIYTALGLDFPKEMAEETLETISTDSRNVMTGAAFIALKGENFDGHDFIRPALEKGAKLIIAENCLGVEKSDYKKVILVQNSLTAYQRLAQYYRQKFSIPVVAITGSNGKTSTKDILACAMQNSWFVLKNEANFNNEIGVPKTIFEITSEHQVAIVEMGMRGLGQIEQLAEIAKPTVAIITTIAPTHIELLGSIENIAKAKAEVFKDFSENDLVILNYDNEYTRNMNPASPKIYFGMDSAADISAYNIIVDSRETKFICVDRIRGQEYTVRIPLLGRHNVLNTLAALAVASFFKLELSKVLTGLAECELSSMRQSIIKKDDNILVINDAYNASPVSMEMALETLQVLSKQGRSIAILGDMLELGEFSEELHKQVGEYCINNNIDLVYTYGKAAQEISRMLIAQGRASKHFFDKISLANEVKEILRKNDVLLFKGSRGMKMEELIEMIF